ncbi:MAG: hypothetical protein NTZ27_11385 [Ignavibacteriales bacterium]|nr:hypothetical protein [Ignavibacteriales bacterium]
MRITKSFLILGIAGLILVSGCNNNVDLVTPSLSDSLIENTPAIVNKQDNFTFAVKAKNYDETSDYTLTLNSTNLDVALAVGNYTLGRIVIEIYNKDNIKIFQGNYVGGVALVQGVTSETFPTKIHFTLTKVSASVSLAIKTK